MSVVSRLLVTAGEPAGIGPDLCLTLAGQPHTELSDVEIVIVADMGVLQDRACKLGLTIDFCHFDLKYPAAITPSNQLKVIHVPLAVESRAGHLDADNAGYVLNTLNIACDACLDGSAQAMITAPVHKGIINHAGTPFSGHTEYLQQRCGVEQVVMMLACNAMRVTLATTHLPLKDVSAAITPKLLSQTLHLINNELKAKFSISQPTIYVCGLNPHAGEDGHLGREEIDVIIPALDQLRSEGLNLIGPLPADTLFNPTNLDRADSILAMYHDQGLPVLKYAGFGDAVNITLGLPIIRTSVDHGTALDLAGTGQANANSLLQATLQALQLTKLY
ncbi:MAG: 4-hydroxythreonine-4-phosphate dehydrogenase PdxA [Oceanospirillaceae bacterium]|nr:4-hydroxythreonine-4-phosphate dehydrogenase PdxA [Oceanospirillaceae bacterium]